MPPVVITLFVSGIVMVYSRYLPMLHHPFNNFFGIMLSIKVLLVMSALVYFIIAVVRMIRHTLTIGWSKYIHVIIFSHMLFIVFFTKAMFHLS